MVTATAVSSMAGAKVCWSHGCPPLRAKLASHRAQLYTARTTMGVGLGRHGTAEGKLGLGLLHLHRRQGASRRQPAAFCAQQLAAPHRKYTKPMLLPTGASRCWGAVSSWLWQSPETMMSLSRAIRYGSGFWNRTWSAHVTEARPRPVRYKQLGANPRGCLRADSQRLPYRGAAHRTAQVPTAPPC